MMDRNKSAKPDFVLEIEDNALGSLKHGIEHFVAYKGDPSDLKFAIIHVFHAVELFLKERLAEEHPLLIYSRPECSISDDVHTVGFDALKARLRNAGIVLQKDDIDSLEFLRKVRNSIEHHKIRANKEEVKSYVGRAARFLVDFLPNELDISLQEKIDNETFKTLEEAIYTYKERLKKALAEMESCLPSDPKDRQEYDVEVCPECGQETLPIPDPTCDGEFAHCFFCGEKFYHEECPRCSRHILLSSKPTKENFPGMCDVCWEEIAISD